MSNEATYLTTPVGRFVMGDAFNGSDKDHQGRPRLDQKGQPKMQWFIALAIKKDDPGWPEFWGAITGIAQRDFPNGEWQRPDFAWKVVDGDAKYPDRDECKGCYVVRLSSGFAPTVYNAQNQQIVDPTQCKRGDYVRVYASINGNDNRQKPGVYINPSMIQVVGFGEAISSGPSPEQAFGAPPSHLPPGASTTPVAPQGGMPAPTGPVPAPSPVSAPAPQPAPPVQPGATTSPTDQQPAPYPAILNGPTG